MIAFAALLGVLLEVAAPPARAACGDCDIPGLDLCLLECCDSSPPPPPVCGRRCRAARLCRRLCREDIAACKLEVDPCRRERGSARRTCRSQLSNCAGLSPEACGRTLRPLVRACRALGGPAMRECVDLFPAQRHGCHPRLGVTLERARVFSLQDEPDVRFLDVAVAVQSLGGAVIEVQGNVLFGTTESDVTFVTLKGGLCGLGLGQTNHCEAAFPLESASAEGFTGVAGDSLVARTPPFPLTPVTPLVCPLGECVACEANGGVCVCGTFPRPCTGTFDGPSLGPCCTLPPAP